MRKEKLQIPKVVVEFVKRACVKKEGSWSYEILYRSLRKHIATQLDKKSELYEFYSDSTKLPSASNLERAFGEREPGYVSYVNNQELGNLLGHYAGRGVSYYTLYSQLTIEESQRSTLEQTRLPRKHNVKILDEPFWHSLKLSSEQDKLKSIARYYTHIDSSYIPKAVANHAIVPPQEVFNVQDADGNREQKTVAQILNTAASHQFSLIEVLAEGGVGKSTFLYWIAYQSYTHYRTFFLEKISSSTLSQLIELIDGLTDNRPILLIVDNIAEAETVEDVTEFIVEVKEALGLCYNLIFIVSERAARYNGKYGRKEVRRLFSGNIQRIEYALPNHEEIFENLYSLLEQKSKQLCNPSIKEENRKLFLDSRINSISEKIFIIIDHLKLHHELDYDFDWDDWEVFIKCNPKFLELENLFIIVACFYQFGIKVPVSFQSSYLREGNRLLILKAITSFGSEKSPLVLADDNTYIALKHEYVASWFLRNGREVLAQGFFRDYLNEIKDTASAKLFRKIRKIINLPEFIDSCIGGELDTIRAVKIIDEYLRIPSLEDDERKKMLNEMGILLLQLGKEKEAANIFEAIKNRYNSNHAKDQLARLFIKQENYQKAFDEYLDIINNKGAYAFIRILSLQRICKKKGIMLKQSGNLEISDTIIEDLVSKVSGYFQHQLVKELIYSHEFDLAEKVLAKVTDQTDNTAKCYWELAKAFPLTKETINRVESYYQSAMDICSVNGQENLSYSIDFAVFLFKIREFGNSTEFKNLMCRKYQDSQQLIEEEYKQKIRRVGRLTFRDLPDANNLSTLHDYLKLQCHYAAALINHKSESIESIWQGYLLLKTVRYCSKGILPNVYFNSLIQMAYCHTYHCDKEWNNYSVRDNRLIAEYLFDEVILNGGYLNRGDCRDMLKNLVSFQEKVKAIKAIKLANEILKLKENQNYPAFYRLRGSAKKLLFQYDDAIEDYEIGLIHCTRDKYRSQKNYNNEYCALLHNIALGIYECATNKIMIPGYNLNLGLELCNQIEVLNPDFTHWQITKQKIIVLLNDDTFELLK